jgi:hypothetical protein
MWIWLIRTPFFIFQYWGLNSGPSPWATSLSPFWDEYFQDRVLWTICLGRLQTVILLISASWVARIIGTSHQYLAEHHNFVVTKIYIVFSFYPAELSNQDISHLVQQLLEISKKVQLRALERSLTSIMLNKIKLQYLTSFSL